MTTLQADRLTYARGDRPLFRDISFELQPGEALWLSGANGSGKTSLLRLLCGLASPLAGTVQWNGQDIHRQREEFHRHLFYYGHAPAIKDELPAGKNVSIASQLAGTACSIDDACHALKKLGLGHAVRLPAAILSQGQRKRVALARLYIDPLPTLLILDEPFSALDQNAIEDLQDVLNRHLARQGIIVYTTHQPLTLKATRLQRLQLGSAL